MELIDKATIISAAIAAALFAITGTPSFVAIGLTFILAASIFHIFFSNKNKED